jgi:hypothetical protein
VPGETVPALTMTTTEAVIDALARAPEIIVPLVREVPAAVLKRRPSRHRWSAHEQACHLAHVHGLFFSRLEQMLREPAPVIAPYNPDVAEPDDFLLGMDLDDALQAYVSDRERLVERLQRLTKDQWEIRAEHGEYSHYSVFIMFRHLALHDFLHAYRIEEVVLKKEWP